MSTLSPLRAEIFTPLQRGLGNWLVGFQSVGSLMGNPKPKNAITLGLLDRDSCREVTLVTLDRQKASLLCFKLFFMIVQRGKKVLELPLLLHS